MDDGKLWLVIAHNHDVFNARQGGKSILILIEKLYFVRTVYHLCSLLFMESLQFKSRGIFEENFA